MSGYVMGTILKYSRSRGTSRIVAVVIGDCCQDNGTGAYPSIGTIAARAGTSERTAQRSIADLEELGEVRVIKNAGPKRQNRYQINIDRLLANGDGDKVPPSDRVKSGRVPNRQGDKLTRASELHPDREGDGGCQNAPAEGDRIQADGATAMAPDPSFGSVSSDPSDPRQDHKNDLSASQKTGLADWPADALWLRGFLETEQRAFSDPAGSRLLDYAWWDATSVAINGVSRSILETEFARMQAWFAENPTRRPTPKGARRFVRTWLERAAEQERRHVVRK